MVRHGLFGESFSVKESTTTKYLRIVHSSAIRSFQWPRERIIALLLFLGDKKRAFPNGFKKVLVYVLFPIVSGLVTYFGWKVQTQPAYWPDFLTNSFITYAAARSFIVSTVCAFVAFIVCRALLPLLFYVPHAMSFRSMGLLEASVRENGMKSCIIKYLKWHDSKKRIKVICISGRNLFGSQGPLFESANAGRLQVLFPKTDRENPTIKARYDTYNKDFRADTYPSVDDLVREVKISKEALKQNARNGIHEHNELCMWRVVLLSSHCIVQNYFPNHSGCHSDTAPVFVYYKEPECPHSWRGARCKGFLGDFADCDGFSDAPRAARSGQIAANKAAGMAD